jgi:16S rRNA (guanine527-N7)-methyltransferase
MRALQEGVAQLPLALSETQITQLIDYLALLVKWNAVYNLTAVRDPTARGSASVPSAPGYVHGAIRRSSESAMRPARVTR